MQTSFTLPCGKIDAILLQMFVKVVLLCCSKYLISDFVVLIFQLVIESKAENHV